MMMFQCWTMLTKRPQARNGYVDVKQEMPEGIAWADFVKVVAQSYLYTRSLKHGRKMSYKVYKARGIYLCFSTWRVCHTELYHSQIFDWKRSVGHKSLWRMKDSTNKQVSQANG